MAKPPVAERPYETVFIAPVDTPQKTVDAFIEKAKSLIAQEKGTFRTLQVWGRRRMTFPIKRQKDGIYIYFDYNASNKTTAALDNLFHVTDFVLRHMTVLREDAPPIPAASVVTEGQAAEVVTGTPPSSSIGTGLGTGPSSTLGTGPSTGPSASPSTK